MTIEPGDLAGKEIERVARAMCKADGLDPDARVVPYALAQHKNGCAILPPDDCIVSAWACYVKLAKIAISELRPTTSKIELVSAGRPVPYELWLRDLKSYAYDLVKPGRAAVDDAQTIKDMRSLFEERTK